MTLTKRRWGTLLALILLSTASNRAARADLLLTNPNPSKLEYERDDSTHSDTLRFTFNNTDPRSIVIQAIDNLIVFCKETDPHVFGLGHKLIKGIPSGVEM